MLIIIGTWGGAVADTVRDAMFTVVAIVSTTGYGTADFELWVPSLQILILGLMFVGVTLFLPRGVLGPTVWPMEARSTASRSSVRPWTV